MGEITITIKTDSAIVVGNKKNESVDSLKTVDIIAPKKKGKSKNPTGHCIVDEKLLSLVLDAGYFNKMRGVNYIDGVNKYFFNYDENIKNIIDEFYKKGEPPVVEDESTPLEV